MRDIVFITIDSLRADHVGCYGYERETTPWLDEVATESHVFERAYAHGPATRVSFPAILSGSSPLMYGGPGRLSEDRTMIAELLEEAGYQTGGFNSNPFLSAQFGYDRGFDTFYDAQSDPTLLAQIRTTVRQTLDSDGIPYRFLKWAFDRTEEHAGVELGSLYTAADDLTDRAIEYLSATSDEVPTFCWVHYMDVHHPYVPPAEHQREFRADPIDNRRSIQLRRKMLEKPEAVTDEELSDIIDLYDAEIRFTDTQMRRLVSHAREQLEDPVIVVTADHGEEFREHGAFSHGTSHKEGVHVPLILNDTEGSGHYEDIVGLLDLPPTFAGYANQPVPESYRGYDLRALIRGDPFERTSVVGEWGEFPGDYYIYYYDEKWKYIRDEEGIRLYHLPEDPKEQMNVREDNPGVVNRIKSELTDYERNIEATQQDTGEVEMDDSVVDRLEQLGYKMD